MQPSHTNQNPTKDPLTTLIAFSIIAGLITTISAIVCVTIHLLVPNIQYANPYAIILIISIISLIFAIIGSFTGVILAIILIFTYIRTFAHNSTATKTSFIRLFIAILLCLLPPLFLILI